MSENKGFVPDSNSSTMQYDYSKLNKRYEADVERNEIIEWNKYESNAQYRSLEKIAERLNFKQMQIETCREDYGRIYEGFEQVTDDLLELKEEYCILQKENEQLKQENEDLKFALRTEVAHQRIDKKEHSNSVYNFLKKLKKW